MQSMVDIEGRIWYYPKCKKSVNAPLYMLFARQGIRCKTLTLLLFLCSFVGVFLFFYLWRFQQSFVK